MLYDPKWEQKTGLYTLRDLIAWLETKSPELEYNWSDCHGGCLLGQYMIERTGAWDGHKYELASRLDGPIHHDTGGQIAWARPRTFGAALERARAAAL